MCRVGGVFRNLSCRLLVSDKVLLNFVLNFDLNGSTNGERQRTALRMQYFALGGGWLALQFVWDADFPSHFRFQLDRLAMCKQCDCKFQCQVASKKTGAPGRVDGIARSPSESAGA